MSKILIRTAEERLVAPCPFCGNENVGLTSDPKSLGIGAETIRKIQCPNCLASGPKYDLSRDVNAEVKALEGWNNYVDRQG